jgi:acyl-CoA thioester hydrolase
MTAPFRYYLRVRYGDCDAQKIVFNARYADYVDIAGFEFFRALGYRDAMLSGALDYQVAKLTLEWKASARFDDVLELSVRAARVGNTSFTLAIDFRIAGGDRVIAAAEVVYVLVEPRSLQKMRIPDDLRAALQSGAAGAVADHAAFLAPAPIPSGV